MNEVYPNKKRGPVISGRVPQELFEEAKKLIDNREFRTMNDVVEAAVWSFVNARKNEKPIEGGESLGN